MHFRILIIIYLLTQSLYAKPLIYFILSNNCPICHNLMSNIKSNDGLKFLLSNEYEVYVIDTTKYDIPDFLPFDGNVPAIFITNNNQLIGNPLKGFIPSNELMKYLIDVKNYLNEKNKRTYYAL